MSTIATLLAGFKVFKTHYFEHRPRLFRFLIERGQQPDTMLIACSDSRVDPAILLNAEPGELFIARNVANLVPPYEPDGHNHGTSSALEFAVLDLHVKQIVVLGHSQCGGINALRRFSGGQPTQREFVAAWVTIANDALKAEGGETDASKVEQAAIRVSLRNLLSFPWIAERVARGELTLHGWWFDIEHGQLWGVRDAEDPFTPLA